MTMRLDIFSRFLESDVCNRSAHLRGALSPTHATSCTFVGGAAHAARSADPSELALPARQVCAELAELRLQRRQPVGIDDFDIYRFLSAGGLGVVLLARKREPSDAFYAVKVLYAHTRIVAYIIPG